MNRLLSLLVLSAALIVTEVQAFKNCLLNGYSDKTLYDLPRGFTYGLKGSYNTTECLRATNIAISKYDIFWEELLRIDENIMAPYYSGFEALIQLSNVQVACMVET